MQVVRPKLTCLKPNPKILKSYCMGTFLHVQNGGTTARGAHGAADNAA